MLLKKDTERKQKKVLSIDHRAKWSFIVSAVVADLREGGARQTCKTLLGSMVKEPDDVDEILSGHHGQPYQPSDAVSRCRDQSKEASRHGLDAVDEGIDNGVDAQAESDFDDGPRIQNGNFCGESVILRLIFPLYQPRDPGEDEDTDENLDNDLETWSESCSTTREGVLTDRVIAFQGPRLHFSRTNNRTRRCQGRSDMAFCKADENITKGMFSLRALL